MSIYSGKLLFRRMSCGCEYECYLYFLTGYDKESFQKFIICSSCLAEEERLSYEDLEKKQEEEKEKMWKLWEDEMKEPGTTDDEWSAYTHSGLTMIYH